MNQSIFIRELQRQDIKSVERLLDQSGLFPSEMLRPMAEPYFAGEARHYWHVALEGERPVGFAYTEAERMTEGTFNLLAIAVEPESRGLGIGKAIVANLMERLRTQGGRVLLVETSSLDQYAATRAFYEAQNFLEEARIRDFYANGEDKLIFWKSL